MRSFDAVQRLFESFYADGLDVGAGLSIWKDGGEELCVSGGTRNADGAPWTVDTLVHTYSVGRPMAALVALIAVARGQLAIDEPLSYGLISEWSGRDWR